MARAPRKAAAVVAASLCGALILGGAGAAVAAPAAPSAPRTRSDLESLLKAVDDYIAASTLFMVPDETTLAKVSDELDTVLGYGENQPAATGLTALAQSSLKTQADELEKATAAQDWVKALAVLQGLPKLANDALTASGIDALIGSLQKDPAGADADASTPADADADAATDTGADPADEPADTGADPADEPADTGADPADEPADTGANPADPAAVPQAPATPQIPGLPQIPGIPQAPAAVPNTPATSQTPANPQVPAVP
ncbi:hypothetical protein AB0J38_27420, partial [Streptomyces sp. NPDC050095]